MTEWSQEETERRLDAHIQRALKQKAAQTGGNWQQAAFTAEDLRLMTFEPIWWIIPDIIPAESVTLLCSRPKFGKSGLAYDLCIGATMNRFILGEITPALGDVLYLALEDSKRRLQRRMTKLLPTFSGKWPEKLTITTKWRRLHEGGLDDIRAWHEHAKAEGGEPILAVVDALAKVRKPTGNKPVYESDYEALTGLHLLSHELGVAVVVVHHTRKMAADDLMETVSGSYGLTGAVDTVIVMANKGGGAVLDVRGRDVESAELAIVFSKDACRWTILGAAAEVHQSDQRKAIIAALVERGEPMKIAELMGTTGMKRNNLEALLGKLVKEQSIKRIGAGLYAHKDYAPPPNAGDKSDRSDRPHTDTDQMPVRPQGADKTQESARSDRSDHQFTGSTARPGSDLRVNIRSDQSDRSDGDANPLGGINNGPSDNLIGRKSDRSDQSESLCAHCGQPGGLRDCYYNGISIRLHRHASTLGVKLTRRQRPVMARRPSWGRRYDQRPRHRLPRRLRLCPRLRRRPRPR
jgi:hypothetical protein